LKQDKYEVLEQLRETQDNVASQERDKEDLKAKLQEEKAQLQREKE
jgi:hypothetical protein